jgi:hypothetical protein
MSGFGVRVEVSGIRRLWMPLALRTRVLYWLFTAWLWLWLLTFAVLDALVIYVAFVGGV